ncbi:hypothetical protein Xbed_03728 [Xenorhabdus beddingii]|uniref:Uncharacterized protein n=1 Tax=Xenorhabdus beddingii TaxID=40578 RepID=A0A1Y2S7M6_9GAMM|nr:hypothetical protein Xbed_03728 [Xenorhabdus beddingii]
MMDADNLPAGVQRGVRVFFYLEDFARHQFDAVAAPAAALLLVVQCFLAVFQERFGSGIFLETPVAFEHGIGGLAAEIAETVAAVHMGEVIARAVRVVVFMQAALRTHADAQTDLINGIQPVGGLWLRVVLQRQAGGHPQMAVTEKQRFILKPETDALFGGQPAEKGVVRFAFLGHVFPILMRVVEFGVCPYPVFFQQLI